MKIAIVSLGWLGQSLYDFWTEQAHEVVGTYHSTPKNKAAEIQYDFNEDEIPKQVLDSDLIFFNLPPSKIDSIENFERFLQQVKAKRFIFISSTSVYGEQGEVTEQTVPTPTSSNGAFLLELEQLSKKLIKDSYIIRPAGLIGDDRHPGRFLSARVSKNAPNQSVNLISKTDLISLIDKIVNQDEVRLLNAVNTHHPSKQSYYTDYCLRNDIAAPIFSGPTSSTDKIISTTHGQFRIDSELP